MDDSTDSTDIGSSEPGVPPTQDHQTDSGGVDGGSIDSDDSHGDAVSGATSDDDGVPTPTGSIPPGPGTPDTDDTTDATALPPLKERMY